MTSLLIVIPAHNEELVLRQNVERLVLFCRQSFAYCHFRIVIAENGSTDSTSEIGRSLQTDFPEVEMVQFSTPGKGAAVCSTWREADEDMLVFMDADLSTDVTELPALVRALEQGADLAIGSRYVNGAEVRRGFLREVGSRAYCMLARTMLDVPVRDWQCGFKGIRAERVKELLMQVRSSAWFFDTELIALVSRDQLKITEVPVRWREAPNSKRRSSLNPVRVFLGFMAELVALRRRLGNGK